MTTTHTDSRTLMCTTCLEQWQVYEIPHPFIDPNLYTCPACLRGDLLEAGQLELTERVDRRRYDPEISVNPL